MIPITKTRLPSLDRYIDLLKRVWDNGIVTNGGELVNELEAKLCDVLDVDHTSLVNNGTIGLMLALRALGDPKGKNIITTPFTYVATTNAITWAGFETKFVDIDPTTFNINPNLIETAIDENTVGILPVHVYGLPCDPAIQIIAKKYNLSVIYDASHSFGVYYESPYSSFLDLGDYNVISLHATKVLGTGEGGVIISKTAENKAKIDCLRGFGLKGEIIEMPGGLNGKMSELQAAFGLASLDILHDNINKRKAIYKRYKQKLNHVVKIHDLEGRGVSINYSYFPILVNNPKEVKEYLAGKGITTRRYFYPSLGSACPISEQISSKVLCLPLYPELTLKEVDYICNVLCMLQLSKMGIL